MNVMESNKVINMFTCLSIDPPYQAKDEPQNASKTFSLALFSLQQFLMITLQHLTIFQFNLLYEQ